MSEGPWRHQQLSDQWHHMMLCWVSSLQDAVSPNWWWRAGTWSVCCVQGLITCCVQGLISCVFHSAEEWQAETLHDVFPKSRRGLAAVRGTWMISGDTNSWLCNCDPVRTGRVHAGTWTVPGPLEHSTWDTLWENMKCDIILYVQKRSVPESRSFFLLQNFTLYISHFISQNLHFSQNSEAFHSEVGISDLFCRYDVIHEMM